MALGITDLKKGSIFTLEGVPYRVVEYNQKVVGRGGSIVNVRIKSLLDGKVLDKTFKGSENIDYADIARKNVDYLYEQGGTYYFMDQETFEQYELGGTIIGDGGNYLVEGMTIGLLLFNGNPVSIELSPNVELVVEYTEDVVKGDTSGNVTKPARLNTGLEIRVPAFINSGDTVSVDTSTGQYRERIKKG